MKKFMLKFCRSYLSDNDCQYLVPGLNVPKISKEDLARLEMMLRSHPTDDDGFNLRLRCAMEKLHDVTLVINAELGIK